MNKHHLGQAVPLLVQYSLSHAHNVGGEDSIHRTLLLSGTQATPTLHVAPISRGE